MKTCESCLFWNFQQEKKYDFDSRECRRSPPAWRTAGDIAPKLWVAAFPETFGDSWCGCWKPRDKARSRSKSKVGRL